MGGGYDDPHMGHQRQSAPVQVRIKQGGMDDGQALEDDMMQPDRSQLQSRGSSREVRPSMPKVDEGAPQEGYGDDFEK